MAETDPFDLLGLPARFDLDQAKLHRCFVALSAEHHPDRFSDPVEQAEAAERSAEVNQAYRLLRDPESRADVLIARLGGPGRGQDDTLPPDLLMEVMEAREQLEQARADADDSAVERLRGWAQQQRSEALARLSDLFDLAEDDPSQRPEHLAGARAQLNALRYFQRLLDQG